MGTPDPRNDMDVLSTCSTNYEGRGTIERAHLKKLKIFFIRYTSAVVCHVNARG